MSHLVADTGEELRRTETALGLPPGSVQHSGSPKEHLDVCESKRKQALLLGATPITGKELVTIVRRKRAEQAAGDPAEAAPRRTGRDTETRGEEHGNPQDQARSAQKQIEPSYGASLI